MNVSLSDAVLLGHAAFGVAGSLAALWVFVEALNARSENIGRIRKAAWIAAASIVGAWICGGYWYLHFYPAERAVILAGPWPFAHNVFMETKEHLFFVTAILALLLPLAARGPLHANEYSRKLVLSIAGLVAITGMAMEGAGAVIDHGVKVALLQQEGPQHAR